MSPLLHDHPLRFLVIVVTRASSSSPASKLNLKSPLKRKGSSSGPKSKEQVKSMGKKLRLDPDSEKALIPQNLKVWELKIKPQNHFHSKVMCFSSFEAIENIRSKVTADQKVLFKKTCFKQFLDLKKLRMQGQI
ncbi:hypothetical protein PanWU01x14_045550 [Parasponia andersonii]|uniref:Uncharacterized protein n=1 Tax=Parasponia andersonii TaxID=3476 RepID=A0A2P5DPI7_PARAD|nr:hypothetical protein PanWU01x14_045550 [Parasponia andersonii]